MELLAKCICAGICLCGGAVAALTIYAVNDWANYITKYKEISALEEP